MVKKGVILGVSFVTALAIAAALLSSTHFGLAMLTPVELKPKQPKPPPPPADDCSDINRRFAQFAQSAGSIHKGPLKNPAPLTADEIAIYRAVTQRWVAHEQSALNVSLVTFPIASSSRAISDCQCLKGIAVESLVVASHSFHNLTRDDLPGSNITLVDPNEEAVSVRNNDPGKTISEGMRLKRQLRMALQTAFSRYRRLCSTAIITMRS